jgi:nucleoside-diphosphate-sugar epimerase
MQVLDMTVLVTGCAGFIGSHLAGRLLETGEDVVGIDNFDPYYPKELKLRNLESLKQNPKFRFFEMSVLDDKLGDVMGNVSVIYHEAAMAGVRNSIREPWRYFQTNVEGTFRLLELARKTDAEKFVFASSSSVYGEVPENELPVREDRAPNPVSPYALSKYQGEQWCRLFADVYGLRTVCPRYFTVYGPGQRPDEAFTKFISKIMNSEEIQIYGDGNQTRDFTYVGDVVSGTILAAQKGNGLYNIGSGNRVTVNEMVEVIGRVMGTQPKTVHIEKQQGDVSHTWSSIEKARGELGYEPRTSLEEGTRKHVEWCKNI